MLVDTSAYLLTLEIGLPVVGLLWFVIHRTRRWTWTWRVGVSTLIAVTLAPTAWAHLGEPWIFPAVWMMRVLWWEVPDRLATFLVLGVGPIVLVTAMILGFWMLLRSRSWMRIYIGAPGRIALPLILFAAICFRYQGLNGSHHPGFSWLVFQLLSFPLGLLAQWPATGLAAMISPADWPLTVLIRWLVGFMGTVLNIYVLATLLVFTFRKARDTNGAIVREDEFRRLLDEHHKGDH